MPTGAHAGPLEETTFEDAAGDWRALAEQAGNLFLTWEWQTTWWRHYGGGKPLHLRIVRRPDRAPVLVLPLHVAAERPVRTLRFVGRGQAQQLGPVCAPADRPFAVAAMRQALDEAGADLLLAEDLLEDENWSELLAERPFRRTPYPVVRLGGSSWDEFVAARTPNTRRHLRRDEKRLAKAFRAGYRLADDSERLDADLDLLFSLHRARWGDTSPFLAEEAFHRTLATLALERGWLRLWFLELDGVPAAALYSFRFGGADWCLQSGRDPRYDHYSPGFVLLAHAVRQAANDGVAEYKLLRGAQAFKERFATDNPAVETFALARTAVGRAALAAARASQALPSGFRRRVMRRAGQGAA